MTGTVCDINSLPAMDALMGDVVPDLKMQPYARRFELPEWAVASRQVQAQLCPSHPDFGMAVAAVGTHGMSMPVHPKLQVFTRDIQTGGRFRDDKPLEVITEEGAVASVQTVRVGFGHPPKTVQGHANVMQWRNTHVVAGSQTDSNNPHRQVFNMRMIWSGDTLWAVGAVHPSVTFADYRKAVGKDVSGDYFGAGRPDGGVDWEVSGLSIVEKGATEQPENVFDAAASIETPELELHAQGSSEYLTATAGTSCSCQTPTTTDPEAGATQGTTMTPEQATEFLAKFTEQTGRMEAAVQRMEAAQAAAAVEAAQAALDMHSELREALDKAVSLAYGTDSSFVWVVDYNDTEVVFSIEEDSAVTLYTEGYTEGENEVTLNGSRTEVREETTYIPV